MRTSSLLGLLAVVVAIVAAGAQGRPVPGAPACAMTPADSFWHADVSGAPVHAQSAELGVEHRPVGGAQGGLRRRACGTAARSASRTRPFPVRSRAFPCRSTYDDESDTGPVSDPAERADRGRLGLERRPPRAGRRPRRVPAVGALQRVPAEGRSVVDGRLRRHLGPRLERDAPSRLDVGRRRRAPDPARARALRRDRRRRDRPRHPLHRAAHGQRVRVAGEPQGRDAAAPPIRPWARGSGSRRASTSAASRRRTR